MSPVVVTSAASITGIPVWPPLGFLTSPCVLHQKNLDETHRGQWRRPAEYITEQSGIPSKDERERQWPGVHCKAEHIHEVTVTRETIVSIYFWTHKLFLPLDTQVISKCRGRQVS